MVEAVVTTFGVGNRRTLSYARRAGGELVVCVPGGPGFDPDAYFTGFELPGREVLVFCPRGTGASSAPGSPDGYRMEGYVDDLEQLRVHLGLDRLTLYGNSYGGSVVLGYASAHPSRVARLVISAAAARVDDDFESALTDARARFVELAPDGAKRLAVADAAGEAAEQDPSEAADAHALRTFMACSVAREGPTESEYLDRLCSAPTNDQASQGMWVEWNAGINLIENAMSVAAPALVIAGELDIVVPRQAVKVIADALPNSTYHEFDRVGHFAAVEVPQDFRTAVSSFLDAT